MIHPDYIRIYSERRRNYDIGHLPSLYDKEPEYCMPENMELGVMRALRRRKRLKYGNRLNDYAAMSDLSLGAHVGIVRKRNALKYNKSRWRWVYGSFRPLWKGPR